MSGRPPSRMFSAESNARFWAMVDRRDPDECWEWRGYKDRLGYGRFKVAKVMVIATRYSLGLHMGRKMQADEMACHRCDNPTCVNPSHLYSGDKWSNMADMVARGRSQRCGGQRVGSKNPNAKLNESAVLVIRDMGESVPLQEIAEQFGVSVGTISSVISKRKWSHV